MKTLGIIGSSGSFGAFLVQKLTPHFLVKEYSRSQNIGSFQEVADCDYLVISIPLNSYTEVLTQLKPLLKPKTIIVDVCSVKEEPISLIKKILPEQPFLATHPLFGPQSAGNNLNGHKIVVCKDQTPKEIILKSVKFFQDLGLSVIKMSAKEHDMLMADVHALTFFIARGLSEYGIKAKEIITPSYKKLLDIAELETHHSEELYRTIQEGNRYSVASRKKIIKILQELDSGVIRKIN